MKRTALCGFISSAPDTMPFRQAQIRTIRYPLFPLMLVLLAALFATQSAHGQNLTYRYIGNPFSLSYCELPGCR